ncbi:CSC1-like protein [Psilocybe cubensis]|uniref:CSC1-like protein n=1 Tax=Psilocybe cubensis TaxID=181762 RepID=A0ACB8GXQ8_PSICU|nr:CSC1-like protein [Psilocybe cubensis]KAH9480428.1 CSC1-like protein [Psilocybe cubensis]
MGTLFWICNGAFRLRASQLRAAAQRAEEVAANTSVEVDMTNYEHPHPQYPFKATPSSLKNESNKGLRLRTIMVSNLPSSLRNEKDLQEYFEYYMSRKVEKPSMGLTSSTQPGFLNKSFAFLFNRAKRLPAHIPNPLAGRQEHSSEDSKEERRKSKGNQDFPIIERVVVARKMTELASLLARREEILVLLETAHIKLANKALLAVKAAMERKQAHKPMPQITSRATEIARQRRSMGVDAERGVPQEDGALDEEERMEQLIEVLGPFVEQFDTQRPLSTRSKKAVSRASRQAFRKLRAHPSEDSDNSDSPVNNYTFASSRNVPDNGEKTIWDALLSLPRTSLDAYQPLVNLSHLFRGKIVPSIDYYTAKLNLLTSLITENRAKAVTDYDPVSTAFVTFADPADARRACKYLAVHPNNPLACLVTMAPAYHDIDWTRVMKSTYRGEFVKDWVVNIGVWGFTLFWIFPVSLLVGLVSIQNISLFWPSLKSYLDRHAWESEVIQSFIPTILVALLALLIPLILLLIAKKAHTITTLSALHDLIMTRYYKFLIVNVLVFFCVGTAALNSFLNVFRSTERPNIINTVASSFPTAGPFYVGWLIFTTAMHGGFELALYWLPNHTLLIHVYAKNYEGEGRVLIIRIIRYTLDGLILSQAVFLAYMVVLKKSVNVGLAGFLIVFTVFVKLIMTRMCRAQFEHDDVIEADIICHGHRVEPTNTEDPGSLELISNPHQPLTSDVIDFGRPQLSALTWKLPAWVNFSYKTMNRRGPRVQRRGENPFRLPQDKEDSEQPPSTAVTTPTVRLISAPSTVHTSKEEGTSSAVNTRPDGYPWDTQRHHRSDSIPSPGPVVKCPPPIPWDDQDPMDLPYDNPYYTKSIENVLWLPRNPMGILDLDDTVYLKCSIPVEVSAGRLGTWLGLGETASPDELSQISQQPSPPENGPRSPSILHTALPTLPDVDGTEDIDLPFGIAKRVKAKETDIENTLRPRKSSMFLRKASGDKASIASASIRQRRPSILDRTPNLSPYQAQPGRARSASVLSAFPLPSSSAVERAHTQDEVGVRPDAHAQADFIAANNSSSHVSLPLPKISRSQNVSAAQAIYHEVLEEERQALHERIEEETLEATQMQTSKSWLTSWAFKKTE